ncbi:MAG: hypothetical protein KBD32_05965 [Burkholderiales bacterium]|nr:hypothetical protein [Burkholderiales bacterium]
MSFKLKHIVLPSGMNKKTVVIALTVVSIAMGGIFYFITSDDAMPTAVKEKTAIVAINDDANSSTINNLFTTSPIITADSKPEQTFNQTELSTNLYSDDYLLNNGNVRNEMINYCANNLLNNQIALTNCNTASKVDRSWYQLSYLTSRFIKGAFNSGADFGLSAFVVLIGLFLVFNIFKVILFFTPNYSRQKRVCQGSAKGATL